MPRNLEAEFGGLAEPARRDVATLNSGPGRGTRILVCHRDKGDGVWFHEQRGMPVFNLFDGAAKETRGHDGIRGKIIRTDSRIRPMWSILSVSARCGKIEIRRVN